MTCCVVEGVEELIGSAVGEVDRERLVDSSRDDEREDKGMELL